MEEKKKKKVVKKETKTTKPNRDSAAKKGIEEIFATSPNNDKEDFVKSNPKKKKQKKEVVIEKTSTIKPIIEEVKKEKKQTHMEKLETVMMEEHQKNRLDKKTIVIITIFLSLIIFGGICLSILNQINQRIDILDKKLKAPETKIEYVNPNYIFFGDSITANWNLDQSFNKHYINKGMGGHQTKDLLYRINEDVIDYQPRKVFILIGTNDLESEKTSKSIIDNINKIIAAIQEGSPNTEIYMESILPINRNDKEDQINMDSVGNRTNNDIQKTNQLIKELCEKKDVTYIDTYNQFVNEDDELKLEYTKEGLHLNDKGYEHLASILKPYL